MKKPVFKGSAVALITPYRNNEVDFDAYGALIDYQIAGGTAALVVCATTGEAPTLTDEEHHACIDYAVKRAAGRIPVIAGTWIGGKTLIGGKPCLNMESKCICSYGGSISIVNPGQFKVIES